MPEQISPDLGTVKQLFDACTDLPAQERAALLDESVHGKQIIREVERLLAISDSHSEREQHADIIGRQLRELSHSVHRGQRLGAYQVEREIGRGGMGIVFLAHRVDGSYDQKVALKIAPSFASPGEIRYFHQERQILARLQHPNIAMLLDGGTTDDQRPYLVMEHLDGRPISEYCREQKLGLSARLKLFLAVCDAVSYAHSHLIVHRDIKPDNVLVTETNQVKLLDFGISKILQSEAQHTQATQLKGLTLAYASPEQVKGETTTTATDVYGLGALLYYLLSEQSPHPIEGASTAKIIEAICFTEPTPPSRVIDQSPLSAQAKLLRGDLDNIVGKALRKEVENRYGSVGELQRDVERYLRHEPVQATPPSFIYRSKKMISRYPAASVLAFSVFLAVSGGLAASMLLASKLRSERDNLISAQAEIQKQAHTAERVTQLLLDMFTAASPANARGRTVNVDELLETAVGSTRDSLQSEPAVKAQLLKTLAQVKFNTGKHKDALTLQQEAIAIENNLNTQDRRQQAADLSKLGDYFREAGDQPSAQKVLAQAAALLRTHPDPELLANTQMRQGLVLLQLGKPREAIEFFNTAQQYWQASANRGGELGTNTRHHLAIAYYDIADFSSAAKLEEEVLQEKIALYGETHPKTLASYQFLGQCYMRTNRWGEAQQHLLHAYRIGGKIFTKDNVTLRTTSRQYANLMRRLGYYREAIDIFTGLLSVDAQNEESTAHILTSRGYAFFEQGLLTQSRSDLDRAHEIFSRLLPDSSSISFLTRSNLGETMTVTGDRDAGIALIEKIRALNAEQYGEDDYGVAASYFRLARIALRERRLEESRKFVQRAREINRKHYARNHPQQLEIDEVEAQIAVASGDWKQAQKAYEKLLERMAEVFPADAPLLAQGRSALGEILWRQGDRTEGARLILHSQAILQRQLPAESYKTPLLQARAALVSH